MAPVTLNEPTVIALRWIDIHRVQHLRCKVQHPSKMLKKCRTTFRNGCMDLKQSGTMGHHSPAMVNHRPASGIPFYRKKIHVTNERTVKNVQGPIEVRIRFFGYETNQWQLKAIIAVELTESSFWLVMAPVNLNERIIMAFRRINIHRVQHLRCKVQHQSKMPKQGRTTFRNECIDLKWNSTMVHRSPRKVNRRPATVIPF